MSHFKIVLQILKDNQFFSKFNKCEFWLRLIAFLRQIACSEGVEVDPRMKEVVKSWPRTLSPTDI